ncbi:glioma pathogenesis-related protein 1 [Tachysurus fulvidraco]|uniref:glioma pathogenesis-related protein 1 n=1 Tax=Tachysurus fulvidraco TaxID=1234273 RepID=UPI001FEDFF96|nr:glioma pathogenesis-related protein 1 [Tachysurus fulvidraco]
MANILYLSIQLSLLLFSFPLSMTGNPLPDITDQQFIESCVNEHNNARTNAKPSASNMRYMTWDDGLAVLARAWARNCLFKHNPRRNHPVFPSVGENIWAGTQGTGFQVKSMIESWVNEVQHYNYYTLACTDICGHYTQVVWATTYKVGCALIFCPDGVRQTSFSRRPGALFVCNYATAGNYPGTRPYKEGPACSECGGEKCYNKLCQNSTRDGTIYNNWQPDWDPVLRECGVFCKAVLIIRPVALLSIFVSVYVIQRHCPNMFAYIN